jgi:hypothetical protein
MSDEFVLFPVKMSKTDREEIRKIAKAEGLNASQLARKLLTDYARSRSDIFSGEVPQHGGKRTKAS